MIITKIAEDKGQKKGKHEIKRKWFMENNIDVSGFPIPVGDYIEITEAVQKVIDRRGDKLKKMDLLGVTKISVDTKENLQEIISNLFGSKKNESGKKESTHPRFRDEIILAQENNIKMYVLVEHGGNIRTIEDVPEWKNPRQFLYEREIRKIFNIPRDCDFKAEVADLKQHGVKVRRGPNTGEELYKAMKTMEGEYGCEFLFCDKKSTGRRIIELLGGE